MRSTFPPANSGRITASFHLTRHAPPSCTSGKVFKRWIGPMTPEVSVKSNCTDPSVPPCCSELIV